MKKKDIFDLHRLSKEQFKLKTKAGFVIVLDNIRSLNNIGSVFRTSDAYLVDAVYLCGITATPPHPDIHKTALGAEESVEWHYESSTLEAIQRLKSEGYRIFSIEQVEGSVSLNDFEPLADEKYAFILGNEVKGVLQEVVTISDGCIELPQFGTKHSLNVSVTAGIVIYEIFRKISLIRS